MTKPRHSMRREIKDGKFRAWCVGDGCNWQEEDILMLRSRVDIAAYAHLIAGNVVRSKPKPTKEKTAMSRIDGYNNSPDPDVNSPDPDDNDQDGYKNEGSTPHPNVDDQHVANNNDPQTESNEAGAPHAPHATDETDNNAGGVSLGDHVHDVEHRGGGNAAGDGIVIGEQNGILTIGRFASVEQVPADSVRSGASSTYDPDES